MIRRWLPVVAAAVVSGLAFSYLMLDRGEPDTQTGLSGVFPELAVEDIEVDEASGLPIVPLATIDGRWWWIEQPDQPLDLAQRFSSPSPVATGGDDSLRRVALLASFADHATAVDVAGALTAAVGDPATEAAWLEEAGQGPGGSFDWLGEAAAVGPFVQVVDRWLVVGDLAYREEFDPIGDFRADDRPVYASPLTLALVGIADSVLAEGDRFGEGAIAFDALCAGDAGRLLPLGQDLADHGLVSGMHPPWIEPGITEDQRRARRTLRLVRKLQAAAFGRVLLGDPEFDRLNQQLSAAANSGDNDRILGAIVDIQRYVRDALPAALPDLGPIADALDPDVVAAQVAAHAQLAAMPAIGEAEPYTPPTAEEIEAEREARLREAEPYGAASGPGYRNGGALFEVALDGGELSLWGGSWLGIERGLGPFVDFLAAGGCRELDVVFHDFDAVRGD